MTYEPASMFIVFWINNLLNRLLEERFVVSYGRWHYDRDGPGGSGVGGTYARKQVTQSPVLRKFILSA